jgi:hypothetical protein
MEAEIVELIPSSGGRSFQQALPDFFKDYCIGGVKDRLWQLFKPWACQSEVNKHCSDEEMALFLDQLIGLVAAAATLHEAGRVPVVSQREGDHD